MTRNILIGIGAGLAAALLFASLLSGTTLAFPLFVLSPLPIAIAGLGFGTYSAAAAAAAASIVIGYVVGGASGGLYLMVFAGPIAWVAHLVGLSRPLETETVGRDWFPLGAVLLRAAIVVSVTVAVAGALVGFDPSTVPKQTLDAIRGELVDPGSAGPGSSQASIDWLVATLVSLVPFVAPAFILLILFFDTWLAARIVRASSLLSRPWIPLWTATLPRQAVTLLVIAVVASFLPRPLGTIAAPFAGAIGFAFALTGYGLVHSVLTERSVRHFILFIIYVFSAIFFVPVAVVLAIAGIADTLLHLRGRRIRRWSGSSPT